MRDDAKLTDEEFQLLRLFMNALSDLGLNERYPQLRLVRLTLLKQSTLQNLRYFYHLEQMLFDEIAPQWVQEWQLILITNRLTL